jgi:tetratricopeptide (TPR) repeat protein
VFLAVGRRALADNRLADAEPALRKAAELAPDYATYKLLADVHRRRGETDKWLATLESFLKQPDPGLYHAQIRVEIANHFMAQKDFKKAHPYAEAAAETWAAWAMLCACRCADGLEEWDKAEEWAKRVSGRYDDATHVWYFWCLRTGRGDRAAAQELVESHFQKIGARRAANDLLVDAVYQAANGKREKAAELLVAANQRQPNPALLLTGALEYDAAGNAARRDRALGAWPPKSNFDPILDLLRATLKKGEKEAPTRDEIEQAIKAMPPEARAFGSYVAGRFLLTRGQKELAVEYLKRGRAESVSVTTVPSALTGLALEEAEKK